MWGSMVIFQNQRGPREQECLRNTALAYQSHIYLPKKFILKQFGSLSSYLLSRMDYWTLKNDALCS
jgi:hypothetical protein